MTRVLLALLAVLVLCVPAAAQKLKVVATFSIIGDMVQCVAQDRAEVATLVGPDADAHVFEPTPAHARTVKAAQLVIANGMGFEPWFARLIKSTGSRARIAVATDGLIHRYPRDPHAWHDPANGRTYYEVIRHGLASADPANARVYDKAASDCIARLGELDTQLRAAFAAIPKAQRRAITTHGAFNYLAAAYDVQFLAPLGTSTDAQPSAKGVAALIEQIKREKITAVFVENITDPRLIEQIARETGVKIGGKLYSDALSTKAGPAPTYLALMRHNVRLLTAAMAPGL